MDKKEYSTLINLSKSNNSFYNVLKNNSEIYLDIYIKTELIILYFKLNKEYLVNINEIDYHLVCQLIKNNFIIENNKIVIEEELFDIEYFTNLIKQIDKSKKQEASSKIVKLNISSKKERKVKQSKPQIIDLSEYQRALYFTMKEREFMFEENNEVTRETLPFILKTNFYFKDLLNYLITIMLSQNPSSCDKTYIELLFFYLALYPFVNYAKDKIYIPFEKADLPQNEIGLKKSTYNDDYLSSLELENKELEAKKKSLQFQKSNLENYSSNYNAKIERIDAHISAIEAKQIDNYYNHYAYRHTNEIYNYNLYTYLIASFEQGNVTINEIFQNPVIKFFSITDTKVEFYCAMHLHTLIQISSIELFIPKQPEEKKLAVTI